MDFFWKFIELRPTEVPGTLIDRTPEMEMGQWVMGHSQ